MNVFNSHNYNQIKTDLAAQVGKRRFVALAFILNRLALRDKRKSVKETLDACTKRRRLPSSIICSLQHMESFQIKHGAMKYNGTAKPQSYTTEKSERQTQVPQESSKAKAMCHMSGGPYTSSPACVNPKHFAAPFSYRTGTRTSIV